MLGERKKAINYYEKGLEVEVPEKSSSVDFYRNTFKKGLKVKLEYKNGKFREAK